MNILLVNDDGYKAKGIITLANILNKKHTITVVAPDNGYSGYSHAMTFYKKVKYFESSDFDYRCFVVHGTPCDCVKFGVDFVFKHNVDLVIGGINDVTNLGTDYFYSGTVNIAVEGAIMDIPSIALSGNCKEDRHFNYIAKCLDKNLEFIMSLTTAKTPLSINIQNSEMTDKGFTVASFGKREYADDYIFEYNNGDKYFSLTGEFLEVKENSAECDVNKFRDGYSTITPISLNWNNTDCLNKLKEKLL